MKKHEIGCDEYRELPEAEQVALASKIISMIIHKKKHLEISKKLKVKARIIQILVVKNGLSRKGPYKGKLPAWVPDPVVHNLDAPIDPRILENPPENLLDGSKKQVKPFKADEAEPLDVTLEEKEDEDDEGPTFREQADVMAKEKTNVSLKDAVCHFVNDQLGYFFGEKLSEIVITTKEGSTYTFRG